jgi:O-antigen/teichoic acid export membrane protein
MRVKDVLWNVVGLAAPAVVAAATVPHVIASMAMERFGLLTLAWGLVAFSGLFDLGIGRATTQAVAVARGRGDLESIAQVTRVARRMSVLFGLAGTVLLMLLVALGLHGRLNYSPGLHREVTLAAYVLAMVIPIQTLSATLRGINEAFERFKGVSLARVVVGSSTFLSPYLTSLFTDSLLAAIAALVLSRLLGLLIYLALARDCLSRLAPAVDRAPRMPGADARSIAAGLLRFGGWITVSSIVYPAMMQADRFLIGSRISATAVAGYTIPYEVVMQSLIAMGALTTVVFPRLSMLEGEQSSHAMRLFHRLMLYSVLAMAGAAFALALGIGPLLELWLNGSVPPQSAQIGRILCLGLVPYTIGTLLTSRLHARGRADITAKVHLAQAPVYLIALYYSIQAFGELGAAWTWSARVLVDTLLLTAWNAAAARRSSGR